MDQIDSIFILYPDDTILLVGDFNADPGVHGVSSSNEQGVILSQYLFKWGYVSAHIHPICLNPLSFVTYESEAYHSSSTIHHFLCPLFVDQVSISYITSDHLFNTSDHLPVVTCFNFPRMLLCFFLL